MNLPAPTANPSPGDVSHVTGTPPKKRRRWPWVRLGVGTTFVVLMCGCVAVVGGALNEAADNATEEDERIAEGGISNGVGSQDATADIGTPTIAAPNAIGVSYIQIPVTNHSSGRSNYHIELIIESADGATQLDTTFAFVTDLEAGQSTTAEAMVTDAESLPADAVLRITKVERLASS